MNPSEIEDRMSPADRPAPVAQALDDAFVAAAARRRIRPAAEIDAAELEERKALARDVRDRLPRVLRPQAAVDRIDRACAPGVAAAARAWRPKAWNLLLLGRTGVGKSTAAAFAFRRLLGVGVHRGGKPWEFALRLQWFKALDLDLARQKHPRGKGEDAPAEIVSACAASVLVLDDVGEERFPEAVSEVIVSRYDDGFPTVITSNLGWPDGLAGHYGEAVARKMAQSADGRAATIVDLTGPA
jgi:DNA replication protein DnaC